MMNVVSGDGVGGEGGEWVRGGVVVRRTRKGKGREVRKEMRQSEGRNRYRRRSKR